MEDALDNIKSIEYPSGSGIRILEKDNASNGQKFGMSFLVTVPVRVTGTKRDRRQFPTLKEAKRFASDQIRGARRNGEAFFKLSTAETQEIGLWVPKLRKKGISITEAMEFAIDRLRPEGGEKLLSEVIAEFQDSKRKRYQVGDLAEKSVKELVSRSNKLNEALGGFLIHQISKEQVMTWIQGLELGPQSKSNYLSIASQVFLYAKQKHFLAQSPTEDITDTERKELHGRLNKGADIKVLDIGEAERLITYTAAERPEFLGVIALGLFCGIRTEELKQLTWEAVKLSEGFVTIGKTIAKKRRLRNVTLPDNAQEWLSLCEDRTGRIAPYTGKKFEAQFLQLRLKAGFKDDEGRSTWPSNGMRHSFGSYHYALHEDSGKTSKELGHKDNDVILFDHYRALTTNKDGERYFAIKPAASAAKVVEFVG
ncbi:MAG: tyrosine-type recombinase/integrase [Opitutales bacterium]|jgi:integrase|nr:tyrosine-type recombinase/integrase [Opitutales bacterium]MDG2168884.1 tyrosine-type recombinase/integrase [Opitutales bacterium]